MPRPRTHPRRGFGLDQKTEPSYFGSSTHPPPSGHSLIELASIGTGGTPIRLEPPHLRRSRQLRFGDYSVPDALYRSGGEWSLAAGVLEECVEVGAEDSHSAPDSQGGQFAAVDPLSELWGYPDRIEARAVDPGCERLGGLDNQSASRKAMSLSGGL